MGADPYSAAIGAVGAAVAGGPSSAESGVGSIGNQFDGSGWTVSTGKSSATGATIARAEGGASVPSFGLAGLDTTTLAMVALIGLIAWKAFAR